MLSAQSHIGNRVRSRQLSYGRVHYNRFRYYDPSIGRYISADPIGQFGGINTYEYALSNPLAEIDTLGLASGRTKNLGSGTSVRIDSAHVPGQQTHAHVNTPKGTAAVNLDGTQSHTGKGSLDNLNRKARKYLQSKGFKLAAILGALLSYGEDASAEEVVGAAKDLLEGLATPLLFDAALGAGGAYFDYFLDAGAPASESCPADPGPPGGDELAGQFNGGFGARAGK